MFAFNGSLRGDREVATKHKVLAHRGIYFGSKIFESFDRIELLGVVNIVT